MLCQSLVFFSFVFLGLAGAIVGSSAEMKISFKPLKGGMELSSGQSPKRFFCLKDQITYKLEAGNQWMNVSGKYATLSFDLEDNHLNIESHNQEKMLLPNQFRLQCLKSEVSVKLGRYIEVVESAGVESK